MSGVTKILERQFHIPIVWGGALIGLVSIDLSAASWDPNGVWISRVYTPPAHRRKGLCSAGMKKLMEAADELGVTLYSGPNGYGQMTTDQIIAWRQRQGFEWVQNGNTQVLARFPKGVARGSQ